jgi:hypothetical protein
MKNIGNIKLIIILLVCSLQACKEPGPAVGTRAFKIQEVIDQMKTNPEWMAMLNEKAIQQNLPLDTIMYKDAVWVVDQPSAEQVPAVADTTTSTDTLK